MALPKRSLILKFILRLLYERVPLRKSADMMLLHLDDPVTEFLPLRGGSRRHELTELPMGETKIIFTVLYIVFKTLDRV